MDSRVRRPAHDHRGHADCAARDHVRDGAARPSHGVGRYHRARDLDVRAQRIAREPRGRIRRSGESWRRHPQRQGLLWNSGRERWRFTTIPKPGEPGGETWAGNSWREGGAPTWLTGSYDPELDLLIWGVGNPKPVFDAAARRGDNLYTNSAVALRGSTGALVWHFQFTPADDHDWDANQIPVLADQKTPQGTEKRVLWANRNAFYYVLDRVSGKYLTAAPFA